MFSGVAPENFDGRGGGNNAIIINKHSIRMLKNDARHTNILFKPSIKVLKKGICGPEKSLKIWFEKQGESCYSKQVMQNWLLC